MQNKKSGSATQKNSGRINAIGTMLSKDQMKRVQGGSCPAGQIILCSLAGTCGAPVGGGYCCIANC